MFKYRRCRLNLLETLRTTLTVNIATIVVIDVHSHQIAKGHCCCVDSLVDILFGPMKCLERGDEVSLPRPRRVLR